MKRERIVGHFALVLGALGSVLAAISMLATFWFGATVADVVEGTVDTMTSAVDRLDARLSDTAEAVKEAGGAGELGARAQGVVDLAVNAQESLNAIDDHPLFSRLPVDTSPVSTALVSVERSWRELVDDLAGDFEDGVVSTRAQAQITDRLTATQDQLDDVNDEIDDVGSQLKLWIRLAALAGFVLCLWGLWAQVALAQRGWRARGPSPQRADANES